MRSTNLRLSNVTRRRKLYLSKRSKQKGPSSYLSNTSSVMTPESLYDSSDELVCTNCVETDYYLAQFCNELLFSPSSARVHLEGLINNPEFPKGDLYLSEIECPQSPLNVSVPVTTYTCMDCNPLDERVPPRQINTPQSNSSFNDTRSITLTNGTYEKRRRELERDLIKDIYELVCDQQELSSSGAQSSARVTKLHVSELAIERMENIQKINYTSQIERIKFKLLQSYRSFEVLDQYLSDVDLSGQLSEVLLSSVPYSHKIKNLEKSLHIHC